MLLLCDCDTHPNACSLSISRSLCVCLSLARSVSVSLLTSFLSHLQYKTCKDGSVLGVTVMRIALLTHCQALTQSCGYTEGGFMHPFPIRHSTEVTILRLSKYPFFQFSVLQETCIKDNSSLQLASISPFISLPLSLVWALCFSQSLF